LPKKFARFYFQHYCHGCPKELFREGNNILGSGQKLKFMARGLTKALDAKTKVLLKSATILICFKFPTFILIVSLPFIVKN